MAEEENLGSLKFDVIADDKGSFGRLKGDFNAVKNAGRQVDETLRKTGGAVGQSGVLARKASADYSGLKKQLVATALGFAGAQGIAQAMHTVTRVTSNLIRETAVFKKGMAEVSTLVDTQVVDMKELEGQVLGLSAAYGMDKGGLSKALYQTISAGVAASDSVKFLDNAINTAVGGVTTAKIAVDGITSSLAAYGLEADKAEEISDSLFVAVKDGKTTMEELSPTIGQVASLANTAGVAFDELNASIATLTLTGLSTSESGTAIRGMLNAILKPTDEAKRLSRELGVEFDINAVKAKGFTRWLEELAQKTGGSAKALSILFPEVRGLNAAIQLTGSGFEKFNSIMDDMKEKSGATREAAEKMKDTLSFKWDRAVEGTKKVGAGLVENIEGPLTKAVENYTKLMGWMDKTDFLSKLLQPGGLLRAGISSAFDETTGNKIYELANEEIDAKIETLQKKVDELNAVGKPNSMWGQGTRVKIDLLKEEIQLLSDVKMERGAASHAAQEEAAKASQVAKEAAAATKEQADRERAEAQRKAEEAVLKAEAASREIETAKELAKEAENNASILSQIDQERLNNSEKIASLQSRKVQDEIDLRRQLADSVYGYERNFYLSNIEHLEAIVEDEDASVEQRVQANKRLLEEKTKLLKIDRDNQVDNIGFAVEAERESYKQRTVEIEAYISGLEKQYDERVEEILSSTLPDKEQLITHLNNELTERKRQLISIEKANKKSFEKIEENGKDAAEAIGDEFDRKLSKELVTHLKTDVELDVDLARATKDSIMEVLDGSLDLAMKVFTDKTSSAVDQLTDYLKKNLSSIGELIGSAFDSEKGGSIGSYIGGFIANVIGLVEFGIDQFTKDEKKRIASVAASKKAWENALLAISATMDKTREWLKMIGALDLSNMSYSELREKKQEVFEKRAEAVKDSIGIDHFTTDDMQNLTNIMGDRWSEFYDAGSDPAYAGNGLDVARASGKFNDSEIETLERLFSTGTDPVAVLKAFTEAVGSTTQLNAKIDEAMMNFADTGIDSSKSTTKEDFLTDLSVERDTGRISDKEYARKLYEASKIGGSDIRDGLPTWMWFSKDEIARYEDQYLNWDKYHPQDPGSSDIIGLSGGGIAMHPTFAQIAEGGVPEAVIPLDRMPEIMAMFMKSEPRIVRVEIENRIDPNIPITQDTTKEYSQRIGEQFETILRSKGL